MQERSRRKAGGGVAASLAGCALTAIMILGPGGAALAAPATRSSNPPGGSPV